MVGDADGGTVEWIVMRRFEHQFDSADFPRGPFGADKNAIYGHGVAAAGDGRNTVMRTMFRIEPLTDAGKARVGRHLGGA